jgi:hypothetical protein
MFNRHVIISDNGWQLVFSPCKAASWFCIFLQSNVMFILLLAKCAKKNLVYVFCLLYQLQVWIICVNVDANYASKCTVIVSGIYHCTDSDRKFQHKPLFDTGLFLYPNLFSLCWKNRELMLFCINAPHPVWKVKEWAFFYIQMPPGF